MKDTSGAGEVSQWVKCLLCQDESLSLDPQLHKKLDMVMVTIRMLEGKDRRTPGATWQASLPQNELQVQ